MACGYHSHLLVLSLMTHLLKEHLHSRWGEVSVAQGETTYRQGDHSNRNGRPETKYIGPCADTSSNKMAIPRRKVSPPSRHQAQEPFPSRYLEGSRTTYLVAKNQVQHTSQSRITMHLPGDVARPATNLTTPHRRGHGRLRRVC